MKKQFQTDEDAIAAVAAKLLESRSALFITGAGLSADSGLPTYRGVSGLYEQEDAEEGVPIESLLSGMMLQHRPELCWKHLLRVSEACQGAKPNRGHEVIAMLESRLDRVWVLTQNVDGFHRQAGSTNVIDIHGDLHRLYCTSCLAEVFLETPEELSTLGFPPRCAKCGGPVRPDVVLFGEALDMDKFNLLHKELRRGFDVVFSIGTTSLFPYIVEPVYLAQRAGAMTVEINPGETDVSRIVDVKIRTGAASALGRIWDLLPT